MVEGVGALLLTRRPLAFGAVAGVLIGTVGTAAEWGWSHVWMPIPWPSALLPEVLVVTVLAGLGGGLVGTFIGGALRVRPEPFPRGARVVFPLAGLLVAGLIAFGLATSPQDGITRDACSCRTSRAAARAASTPRSRSTRRRRPTTRSG